MRFMRLVGSIGGRCDPSGGMKLGGSVGGGCDCNAQLAMSWASPIKHLFRECEPCNNLLDGEQRFPFFR